MDPAATATCLVNTFCNWHSRTVDDIIILTAKITIYPGQTANSELLKFLRIASGNVKSQKEIEKISIRNLFKLPLIKPLLYHLTNHFSEHAKNVLRFCDRFHHFFHCPGIIAPLKNLFYHAIISPFNIQSLNFLIVLPFTVKFPSVRNRVFLKSQLTFYLMSYTTFVEHIFY